MMQVALVGGMTPLGTSGWRCNQNRTRQTHLSHKPGVKMSPKISSSPSREVTWQTVVICVTGGESGHHQLQEKTWGRVEDDFREVPCGFSRHLLPLTNPLHNPSRSPMWQTGSLPGPDDKWMAGMHGPEGATGSGLGGAHPSTPPQGGGANPGSWHMQRSRVEAMQTGWVSGVAAVAASAHCGRCHHASFGRWVNPLRNIGVSRFFGLYFGN